MVANTRKKNKWHKHTHEPYFIVMLAGAEFEHKQNVVCTLCNTEHTSVSLL